jgi:hypothetical protein
MIMNGVQELDKEFIDVMVEGLVKSYIQKHQTCKYYLLLNRETYDFTMFARVPSVAADINKRLIDELMMTVLERGTLKSISLTEDEEALQFWIDDKAYYFFEYGKGVIEV